MTNAEVEARAALLKDVVDDLCSDGPTNMKATLLSLRKVRTLAREMEAEVYRRVLAR